MHGRYRSSFAKGSCNALSPCAPTSESGGGPGYDRWSPRNVRFSLGPESATGLGRSERLLGAGERLPACKVNLAGTHTENTENTEQDVLVAVLRLLGG